MPAITLAEAKLNTQTDLDTSVIDEFQKAEALLNALPFEQAVNPAGGGATLTYGYRRQITQAAANFRAINAEYATANVTTQHFTTELKPLGGAFEVDRVSASLGKVDSGTVSLNIRELVKATAAKFQDAVINGDVASDVNGFDGLSKALTGSTTEYGATAFADWSDFDTNPRAEHKALDAIDEWLSLMDGEPTIILGNRRALARVRAAARRAGMYTKDPVANVVQDAARGIVTVERYGNIIFADAGTKAGATTDIIPVTASKTIGGSAVTNVTDLYAIRAGLNGFHAVTTAGTPLLQTWLPDFSTAGAVKKGEVEMSPVSVALKSTKAASVFRNIKVA